MNTLSSSFLQQVREIAPSKFPPSLIGKPGKEPFCKKDMLDAAFGIGNKHQSRWDRWSSGTSEISLDEAACICRALGVSLPEVVTRAIIAIEQSQKSGRVPTTYAQLTDSEETDDCDKVAVNS